MKWFTVFYDINNDKPGFEVFDDRAAALAYRTATTSASLEVQVLFLMDVDRRASP